jgi:antitoxin PrlF
MQLHYCGNTIGKTALALPSSKSHPVQSPPELGDLGGQSPIATTSQFPTMHPQTSPESTLTDRYQTTVPDSVRKALGLSKRDKIRYTIQPDGTVLMARAEERDPIVEEFLDFLARDLGENPDRIQTISPELVSHVRSLVSTVAVDLDAPLSDEDE